MALTNSSKSFSKDSEEVVDTETEEVETFSIDWYDILLLISSSKTFGNCHGNNYYFYL